jgi:hypothetical protein
MKLKITTDQWAQKLLMLYDLCATPNYLPKMMREYPEIFKERRFQEVSEAYEAVAGKIPGILFGKVPLGGRAIEAMNRIQLADRGSLNSVAKIGSRMFHEAEPRISRFISSMFEVTLPDEITLILLEKESGGKNAATGGCMLCSEPLVIGCYVERTGDDDTGLVNSMLCILLHELLHGILPHKNFKGPHSSSNYEEALISYFAPDGILAERLGLIRRKSVDEYFSNNFSLRPNLKGCATKLLPMIKKYYKSGIDPVWKFVPQLDDDNEPLS